MRDDYFFIKNNDTTKEEVSHIFWYLYASPNVRLLYSL